MDFNNNLDKAMKYLHQQGAFLTARNEEKINTMTISWGSVGFMWKKHVFMILVRPQRYTNNFIKNSKKFTVSIPFGEGLKKALGICGSKSGRDINKEKEANISFISGYDKEFAVVDKCNMYYECNVIYSNKLKIEELPENIRKNFYGSEEPHILYFGEIINCYEK
ncbi:MAG: flavin reductase [Clostridium perfringens]|nr:flavin reductase [Clostridium perfringens]